MTAEDSIPTEMATTETHVLRSINPANEHVLAEFEAHRAAEIDQIVGEAYEAQRRWRATPLGERTQKIAQLGRVLKELRTRWASLITAEMGKPIVEAEAEVDKCVRNCEFYAEKAAGYLTAELGETKAAESYVSFEPLGVVLAVMPWNYPFWQAIRFLAPALAAGNGAVLKHASNVPQCALALEEACRLAGLPEGLFRSVLVPAARTGALIADARIAAVTLTGSSEAGAEVASLAGRHLKKQVLELGGSDPFIVLADADLSAAAMTGARSRNQNAGQSCIAAKRFVVEAPVADEFTERLVAAVAALRVGDPVDRSTNVGPLARDDLRAALTRQIEASVGTGAEVVLGGEPLDGPGFFFAPTVIHRVSPEMAVVREETFGPVAVVVRANGIEEAVALANDSEYGLGATIFTRDVDLAKSLARRIEAGVVFVNGQLSSQLELPFGGIKRSGYGRELGRLGIREFTNVQTVCVATS